MAKSKPMDRAESDAWLRTRPADPESPADAEFRSAKRSYSAAEADKLRRMGGAGAPVDFAGAPFTVAQVEFLGKIVGEVVKRAVTVALENAPVLRRVESGGRPQHRQHDPDRLRKNLENARKVGNERLAERGLDPDLPSSLGDLEELAYFTWNHSAALDWLCERLDEHDHNFSAFADLKKQLKAALKSAAPKATKARARAK